MWLGPPAPRFGGGEGTPFPGSSGQIQIFPHRSCLEVDLMTWKLQKKKIHSLLVPNNFLHYRIKGWWAQSRWLTSPFFCWKEICTLPPPNLKCFWTSWYHLSIDIASGCLFYYPQPKKKKNSPAWDKKKLINHCHHFPFITPLIKVSKCQYAPRIYQYMKQPLNIIHHCRLGFPCLLQQFCQSQDFTFHLCPWIPTHPAKEQQQFQLDLALYSNTQSHHPHHHSSPDLLHCSLLPSIKPLSLQNIVISNRWSPWKIFKNLLDKYSSSETLL